VIGRSFLYPILERITDLKDQIDKCLNGLERLDLIKTKTIQPDLEYIFKHALTQEVAYNGLLKKERQLLHEKIGSVMEQLFQDRLPEFYETLAYHFARGLSLNKSINYLMKSGKKSLARYSIEESHQYYKQAFELLDSKVDKTNAEKELLIELLIEWAYVLYYRGYFKKMAEIFNSKKSIAESLEDKTKLGMFYSWYGWALFNQNKVSDSYTWFEKALQIGEENEDQRLIGYACTWLTWYYAASGKLDRSIEHGERAKEISKVFKTDAYLYFKSLGGLGFAYVASGGKNKTVDIGNKLVDYGKEHSNIRSLTIGYGVLGAAYQLDNDLTTAIEAYEKAIQVGVEPFYVEFIRMNLVLAYIMNGQITEAVNAIDCIVAFSHDSGAWITGIPAHMFSGAALIAKGQMGAGLKRLEEGKQELLASGNIFYYLQCEYILAKVFSQIAERAEPINLSTIVKNVGFITKNVPFASKKAEGHFIKVIEIAEEMGAKIVVAAACLDLGLLHKTKKRKNQANKFISKAVKLFEQCEADVYLKQAREALDSLG
jgi:tetratricopeptide (TPR) repeat protein